MAKKWLSLLNQGHQVKALEERIKALHKEAELAVFLQEAVDAVDVHAQKAG